MRSRCEPRGKSAFTLIELLVVIGILAVLASLVLPVWGRAKVQALRAQCSSNLRQLGLGMILYADDHEGWLPETTHGTVRTQRSWIFTLRPYLGDVDTVRACPADPRARERLRAGGTSYVLNEYTAVDLVDPFGRVRETYRNVYRLWRPTETITVFIGAESLPPGVTQDHTHSRNWDKGWVAVIADIEPNRFRTRGSDPERLNGSANYLFADGHVTAWPATAVKLRVDRGDNFARPPEPGAR